MRWRCPEFFNCWAPKFSWPPRAQGTQGCIYLDKEVGSLTAWHTCLQPCNNITQVSQKLLWSCKRQDAHAPSPITQTIVHSQNKAGRFDVKYFVLKIKPLPQKPVCFCVGQGAHAPLVVADQLAWLCLASQHRTSNTTSSNFHDVIQQRPCLSLHWYTHGFPADSWMMLTEIGDLAAVTAVPVPVTAAPSQTTKLLDGTLNDVPRRITTVTLGRFVN